MFVFIYSISYISYDVFIFLRVLMQTKDIFYVSLCKPYHCHSHLSLNVPPRPQQPPRLYIQYKCAVIHAARDALEYILFKSLGSNPRRCIIFFINIYIYIPKNLYINIYLLIYKLYNL